MTEQLTKELVAIRRELHRNPELGYKEFKTADLICRELDKLGIHYQRNIAVTGVIAELSKGEGPCIALRADMDALPLPENSGVEFSSVHENIMHACGHDVHTTMLLGACALLKDAAFNGKIKFIFQPSEEGVYDDPEKKSGGQRIVESGALGEVKAALGLHVHPLIDAGKLAYTIGEALACTNFFTIEVRGKAGHAGVAPQMGIDAILVAANLVMNLNTIVSRNIAPGLPAVLSVTKISGGIAPNIIPDHVTIEGTVRSFDLKVYETIMNRMKEVMDGGATTYGAAIELKVDLYYPSLLNDAEVHKQLVPVISEVFGSDGLIPVKPLMGGEDFAFYSRKVPSMFYFIGAKNTTEPCYMIHDPKVVFNEACIPLGAKFLAEAAIQLLQ